MSGSVTVIVPVWNRRDLLERFLANAPLSEVSWPTVYASGPKGYTDYPAHDAPTLAESSEEEYSNSHERMEELV